MVKTAESRHIPITSLNKQKLGQLVQAIKQLQAADVWVAGLDLTDESQPLGKIDLNMPLAIVVGHEGQGLRRLVGESCDFLIRLPMRGHVESLNAAVAGSVMLYQAWQARGFVGDRGELF